MVIYKNFKLLFITLAIQALQLYPGWIEKPFQTAANSTKTTSQLLWFDESSEMLEKTKLLITKIISSELVSITVKDPLQEVIAKLWCDCFNKKAVLQKLHVHNAHKNLKIGSYLIDTLKTLLLTEKHFSTIKKIELNALPFDHMHLTLEKLIEFYQKHGTHIIYGTFMQWPLQPHLQSKL